MGYWLRRTLNDNRCAIDFLGKKTGKSPVCQISGILSGGCLTRGEEYDLIVVL